MDRELEGLLLLLLRQGNNTDAIELYCEETGAARTEAKRQVVALAEDHAIDRTLWGYWSRLWA